MEQTLNALRKEQATTVLFNSRFVSLRKETAELVLLKQNIIKIQNKLQQESGHSICNLKALAEI